MLHVEKKRDDVILSLRKRKHGFSAPLYKAFAIALSVHLFAGAVFYIQPLFLSNETVLLPIAVEGEVTMNQEEGSAVAFADQEKIPWPFLLPPKLSMPTLPSVPVEFSKNPIEPMQKLNLYDNPFLSVEEDWSYFTQLNPQTPVRPFSIELSGPIGDTVILDDGLSQMDHIPVGPCCATFSIQIDSKAGKIFWFTPHTKISDASIAQFCDTILKRMRFQTNEKGLFNTGEIAFFFTPETQR